MGAIAVGGITDCALTYISLHTAAPELSWLKLGWEAEALLLIAAAITAARGSDTERTASRPDLRDRGLTMVLGGVAATLVAICVVAATTTSTPPALSPPCMWSRRSRCDS